MRDNTIKMMLIVSTLFLVAFGIMSCKKHNPSESTEVSDSTETNHSDNSKEGEQDSGILAPRTPEQAEKPSTMTISDEQKKFYELADLAKKAYDDGDLSKAGNYANELLALAVQYKNDWNYGNAIHHGNLILGRISLKSGDLEKSKQYLINAGKTPGSPQLNSFGPNMALAKELLEKNEREIVIQYFELCGNFWEMGQDKLKKWAILVRGGGTPEFGANLLY